MWHLWHDLRLSPIWHAKYIIWKIPTYLLKQISLFKLISNLKLNFQCQYQYSVWFLYWAPYLCQAQYVTYIIRFFGVTTFLQCFLTLEIHLTLTLIYFLSTYTSDCSLKIWSLDIVLLKTNGGSVWPGFIWLERSSCRE